MRSRFLMPSHAATTHNLQIPDIFHSHPAGTIMKNDRRPKDRKKKLITAIAALTVALMILLGGCAGSTGSAGGDGTGGGAANASEKEEIEAGDSDG